MLNDTQTLQFYKPYPKVPPDTSAYRGLGDEEIVAYNRKNRCSSPNKPVSVTGKWKEDLAMKSKLVSAVIWKMTYCVTTPW
jgi:hypothetical protein